MRFQCPTYLKKVDSNKSTPRDFKSKKAYIVWDVPEEDMTSNTSGEEETRKLCLMTRTNDACCSNSKEANSKVYSNTSSTSSDDSSPNEELYNAYVELHDELKKLARISSDRKRLILLNEQNIVSLQIELDELKLENETLDLIYSYNACNCSDNNLCQPTFCDSCDDLKKETLRLNEKLAKLIESPNMLELCLVKPGMLVTISG
uniref:Uncharacterized protein n=1 Tax=Lupinus angustifolius TaxID=3871 RepID=A0A172GY38_LUPAN|nr:hypothetical protein [Lupinus angustifolius]